MTRCLACNREMVPIKNDFPGRRYHKKCYFEKQHFDYIASVNYKERNDALNKLMNPEVYSYLDKIDKEFDEFMKS